MSEWILFVYPLALIGYLMLAARWQPKASPAEARRRPSRRERDGVTAPYEHVAQG